jgi:hypothetical protein
MYTQQCVDADACAHRTVSSTYKGIEGLSGARRMTSECSNTGCYFTIQSAPNRDERLCTNELLFPVYIEQFASVASRPFPCQHITFTVQTISVSDASLFKTLPSISSDGTLMFEATPYIYGSGTFSVALKDDGLEQVSCCANIKTTHVPLSADLSVVLAPLYKCREDIEQTPISHFGSSVLVREDSVIQVTHARNLKSDIEHTHARNPCDTYIVCSPLRRFCLAYTCTCQNFGWKPVQ